MSCGPVLRLMANRFFFLTKLKEAMDEAEQDDDDYESGSDEGDS